MIWWSGDSPLVLCVLVRVCLCFFRNVIPITAETYSNLHQTSFIPFSIIEIGRVIVTCPLRGQPVEYISVTGIDFMDIAHVKVEVIADQKI